MDDIKKEIEEQIRLAFSTPDVMTAIAKHEQAKEELREVLAMRDTASKKIEASKAEAAELAIALKNVSRGDAITSFQKKRKLARNLKDAEDDLVEIDENFLSPATALEQKTAKAVEDMQFVALESVWHSACNRLQQLVDAADGFLAVYNSTIQGIPNFPNCFRTQQLLRATNELENLIHNVDYHCSAADLGNVEDLKRREKKATRKDEEKYQSDMAAAAARAESRPKSHMAGSGFGTGSSQFVRSLGITRV